MALPFDIQRPAAHELLHQALDCGQMPRPHQVRLCFQDASEVAMLPLHAVFGFCRCYTAHGLSCRGNGDFAPCLKSIVQLQATWLCIRAGNSEQASTLVFSLLISTRVKPPFAAKSVGSLDRRTESYPRIIVLHAIMPISPSSPARNTPKSLYLH